MIEPAWEALLEAEPAIAEMFAADARARRSAPGWLSCREVLERYFDLEDPRRLEPAERELYVETLLDSKLLLRGFVDRLDVAPNGAIRVVDYKTGRSPARAFEAKALFQMKFYALVIWRTRGVVPAMLQLIYLGNGEMLRYAPDEADLLATERKVEAIWQAIRDAPRDRRLAAEPQPAVRLVQPPGHLPGVRRHPPAAADLHDPAAGGRPGRRPRHRRGHRRPALSRRGAHRASRRRAAEPGRRGSSACCRSRTRSSCGTGSSSGRSRPTRTRRTHRS